jgi:uncharacterized protein YkwD
VTAIAAAAWAPPAASAATPSPCPDAHSAPTAANAAKVRTALVCLINEARDHAHARALRTNAHLQTAAQRYAKALDPHKSLRHTTAGGSTTIDRIAKTGYGGGSFSAAETLGRADGTLASPAARVKTWLADASTGRLLLSARYRDVGVGLVTRGTMTTFVVEIARDDAPAKTA